MNDDQSKVLLGSYFKGNEKEERPLEVPLNELHAHGLITGQTRMGKSRWIAAVILQALSQGRQVIFLDPHGSTFQLIQSYMVKHGAFDDPAIREKTLFYDVPAAVRNGRFPAFDVINQGLPIHSTAEAILDALHRVWPELDAAPAFDACVMYGCAVLAYHQLPLNMLQSLLTDWKFRKPLIDAMPDDEIVSFFQGYFEKIDKGKETGSTLRRVFRLTFNPELRYSLGNNGTYNLANFKAILAQERSVLINLNFASDVSTRLWGALLLVAIEQAAMQRLDETLPAQCLIVIDEFVKFIGQSTVTFNNMLPQTAKAGVAMYLCHQNMRQIPPETQGVLDNCALRMVFEVGEEDAEYFAPYFFDVDPMRIKETQYGHGMPRHVFFPIPEQRGEQEKLLMRLAKRQAVLKLPNGEVYGIYTPDLPDVKVDPQALAEVQKYYLDTLFRPQKIIEDELEERRQRALATPPIRTTTQPPKQAQPQANAPVPNAAPVQPVAQPTKEPVETKPAGDTIRAYVQPQATIPAPQEPETNDDEEALRD